MDELISLSSASLDRLSIKRPRYDRAGLTPGIIHIGVGNFHRAHQAWYLHRLMQTGKAHDWAIIGAGVRPYDAEMRQKLLAQDCLTTLIELDPGDISAEVIGSMIDYLPIERDNAPLVQAMVDPSIRIVAMTVTESGYYVDPVSRGFDADHPDMIHDAQQPGSPRTTFGAMIAALRHRRNAGHGPFTSLSCDNLQGNGAMLQQTVTSLARMSDPDLADWIDANVTFPNSMVDCIVPATGPKEHSLAKEFGIQDAAVVTHEAYRQWVLEDKFCAGRPDWDQVGATFTDNVHDFEKMKMRILNGGHQILANVGEVLGIETIAECMADPMIAAFFRKVQMDEIAPTVRAVPGTTPGQYISLIEKRFSNRRIVDTTRRVAFDGSARHPGFLLPILRDQLSAGRALNGLALAEALWARMCEGTRENGSAIEPNDPIWPELSAAARTAKNRPAAWLEQKRIYGDLIHSQSFVDAFAGWLAFIWSDGCEAALAKYSTLS